MDSGINIINEYTTAGPRALGLCPRTHYMKGLNGSDFVPAELKLTDLAIGTGI